MARHEDARSSSESWDVEEDDSEELLGSNFFPAMQNRLLTGELLGNALRASDLRIALEALAKYTNDPRVEFTNQETLPAGWEDAKEFIAMVLPGVVEKFYRMDVFLRVHQDYPEQLFACMYFLCFACAGLTNIFAEYSTIFEDLHDQELCGLLNATYSLLDSRSAVYTLPCVRQLPSLDVIQERTENYLMAEFGVLSNGESDDEVAEPTEGVIHVHRAEGGNQWQAYLVQMLLGTLLVENAVKIIRDPRLHTMHLHSTLLGVTTLVIQLLSNVVHMQLSQERRKLLEQGLGSFLSYVETDLLTDPEKLFSGRDLRASQWLSHALVSCHELMEELQLPNTQLTAVQRQLVIEMLKSSNFSRLLSAVQECRSLLIYSSRRSSQMVESGAIPDMVGIEDNVRWLDQERIVKQMLRVNLHQAQYVDAVLGILRVLAECGHFNDEHLDMLWGVTEQEDTFDAVKTNVCHMIKQLAQHLRPQQLDLLFSKFENRKGRTLPDTLRLLDLLRRLALSDTKKASSMAGKLMEMVWELTTPADAPPELLNSSVMQDVLEGYKQHALLQEYIQRCISQLRARTNVYTALTVLQNLLRLWGKLYGWEPRTGQFREERRAGGPRPLCDLLSILDRENTTSGIPPLSRLLVDNLCDFMATAARRLEERGAPPAGTAGTSAAAGSFATTVAGSTGGSSGITLQPPGQGSYSYQQIVRRYLDVFRLVSQCKDTYVDLRLVEALWDAVVLRPNTPEDMPSGLDLVLVCSCESDGDAQAAAAEGMVIPPGPLLEPRDLCRLLKDRVTLLPVENLAPPAFACFKACLQAAQAGLQEHLRHLAANPGRGNRGELNQQETMRLVDTVRALGQGYLWQIVLDCQRSEVTSSASEMVITEMYGRDGTHALISDIRTRLMSAAALLTSAPPSTTEWETVELPTDVMESSRWEQARTRATRCMQLLEQLAGMSEEAMSPVPMHSASWQGPSLLLEVTTQEHGRIKIGCTSNEYVGLLRRKVAQRLGVEPACVRLVVGGQELRTDGRTLQSALPPTWSARQSLLAQISPRPNRYTRFGEEWWETWHSSCTLAHMFHDDQLYRVLLLLADLPKAPGVRAAASRLLQQLPTCSWVPLGLLEALYSDQPAAQLGRQLLGSSGGVERPGLLLYTLQALYALLQPSYPADLLPLVSKPWRPQQQAGGADAAASLSAPEQQNASPPQGQQLRAGCTSPAWWQVVASGGAAERLLPVLAKCVPLLADVVDKVMAPVAGTAEAAAAAVAAAGPGGLRVTPSLLVDSSRLSAVQPAADLAFVKDFQWVMVFLLCNIYQRARRGPCVDSKRQSLAGAVAAGATARLHPADSLSSSQGQEHHDAGASIGAVPPELRPHCNVQQSCHNSEVTPSEPMASGAHDSDAVTQEAAGGHLYVTAGGAGATPEVTSADAEACISMQEATTQEGEDSVQPQLTNSSGPAAAAAALVSGLAVSSRGSPDGATDVGKGQASSMCTSVDRAGSKPLATQPVPQSMAAAASRSPLIPGGGSSTDVDMPPVPESLSDLVQQRPPAALSPANTASPGVECPLATAVALPASGSGSAGSATDGHANLLYYLGADGMRCLVSLLVRMAHDAGCLWGYGHLLVAQQQAAMPSGGGGRSVSLGGSPAAAAVEVATVAETAATGAPSYQQMCSAADVSYRLASKALQVLARLVQWPDMRDAFVEDARAVPMLLETLACVFSPAIRDYALGHLEGVFAGGPQVQLLPRHYMWVLTSLVELRPAMETRLDSCLEFHVLLGKVLHQLPELASPSAEARLLADSVLCEEVTRLDVGAEELMQPKRSLLLRGKLMLVRELVRALERLGLGLGANGRPGLISLLLKRYLFPEATPLWQPAASLCAMEAALEHVASDPGMRREALQLVQFLMTACPSNLEQGLRDLAVLHYDNGLRIIDRKFDIGGEGVRGENCYVGLRNGGATCYMNSVLQQLYMQPRIRELVLSAGAVDPEDQQDSVFHQLQVMFAHLRLGRASCFHPRGFWQSFKDYDGQSIDVREHQDAYEFFTRLQDSVDSYLRATGQIPAMQSVMGGKFAAQIICKDVNYRSEREEDFYQISVEVNSFHTLEKSLDGYVAGELMEGDNSYYCEELGARVAAVRRTVIKELPHTLVIHLKRFEYDHLNMTRYKLRDRFEFPVTLDMFKYTADGVAALEATGSAVAVAAGASASASGTSSGSLGIDGAVGASGRTSADVDTKSRNCYLYELKGIVVHSGTAFAGHYYSFIKERPCLGEDGQVTEGGWYRFDDKVVSPWSIQDLEADCFGGKPASSTGGGGRADTERPYSAYMLFYERRDAPACDQSVAEMRSIPRDVVIAAAATPTAPLTPAETPTVAAATTTAVFGRGSDWPAAGGAGERPSEQTSAGADVVVLGDGDAMETDGISSSQEQQHYGGVGCTRLAEPAVVTTPYGMPVQLFLNVLRDNLQLMHKLHTLNKEYFAFVRQVVEVTWETVLAGRKTRRRDLHHPTLPHCPPGGSHGASGSGVPVPPSSASGAAGGGNSTPTATASGGAASASGGTESCSAPSQRNEELDETVLLSARLATAFLLNVYLPAPLTLRSDLVAWRDMLRHLLQASPRACIELLCLMASNLPLQSFYFVRSGQDGLWIVEVITFALQAASRAVAATSSGGVNSIGGGSAAEELGSTPMATQHQQSSAPQHLHQQLQSTCVGLTTSLCELEFGFMHDQKRSEPQHLPLCRALAALITADPSCAWYMLGRHLSDVFALPGFILNDLGAHNDPDMLPDLNAALQLLHALMQYCYVSVPAHMLGGGANSGGGTVVVRMPVGGCGGGADAAARPAAMELTGQLEELLEDDGVFDAAIAHGGLLHQPHVIELIHFLLAGNGPISLQLLNVLMNRLGEAETSGAALVEMLEALPAVLDVPDALRLNRFYALIFGHGAGLRSCLQRLAVQALQRPQGLNWQGMVAATALATLWTGADAARDAVHRASAQSLAPLVTALVGMVRQLNEFAAAQAERGTSAGVVAGGQQGAGSQGGTAVAARDAVAQVAALAARVRRVAGQLNNMLQACVQLIQPQPQPRVQEREQQGSAPGWHPKHQHYQQQDQRSEPAAYAAALRPSGGICDVDKGDGSGFGGPVRVDVVNFEAVDEERVGERHCRVFEMRPDVHEGGPIRPQVQGHVSGAAATATSPQVIRAASKKGDDVHGGQGHGVRGPGEESNMAAGAAGGGSGDSGMGAGAVRNPGF